MKLSVIIVNFNGARFIRDCLDSIISQKKFYSQFKIIFIENASEDHSLDIINDYINDIELIVNQENVGFPAAHNQILDQLDTPYLWLLNNDTQFDHSIDVISPIIDYLDSHENVVGLSPMLLNTDGSLQSQGGGINAWKYRSKKITEVGFLSGASLFMRTNFFKQINGFDPHLFFYNDDIDFAKQAKRHNKKLIYFPDIKITHHGGLSTKFREIDSLIAGYYGSIYICKKFYPYYIFITYYYIMRLLLEFKKGYHNIVRTNSSDEWVEKLDQLKGKLKNEI